MLIKTFSLIAVTAAISSFSFTMQDTLKESIKRGEEVYTANCASCHMPQGEGLEGVYPPVAKTSYLKDQQRAIGIILHGQEGEITVNGKTYNSAMASFGHLSDKEIADVLNYVNNSWGNKYPPIKPAQVKALRK